MFSSLHPRWTSCLLSSATDIEQRFVKRFILKIVDFRLQQHCTTCIFLPLSVNIYFTLSQIARESCLAHALFSLMYYNIVFSLRILIFNLGSVLSLCSYCLYVSISCLTSCVLLISLLLLLTTILLTLNISFYLAEVLFYHHLHIWLQHYLLILFFSTFLSCSLHHIWM